MDTDKKSSPGTALFPVARFGRVEVVLGPELHNEILQRREVPATEAAGNPISAEEHNGFDGDLRDAVDHAPYRFCTPSILPEVLEERAALPPETSISLSRLGSHLTSTGPLGAIGLRAAERRGASTAFVSFGGSTFSNQVVLAHLGETRPGRTLLLPANAHHSLVSPAARFGVPIAFIGGQRVHARFEAVQPPTPADVAAALARHPDAAGVVVTSPSYEGICADIAAIADVVHRAGPDCLLIVDQAWGAHLGASDALPPSAIGLGADVACESTHKMGGTPNQLGLLLCDDRRVDVTRLGHAYRDLVTTSPSFPLAAHLDTALAVLHGERGRPRLASAIATAAAIRARIDHVLPGSVMVGDRHMLDPLKVTVSLDSTSLTGFAVRNALAEHGVIVERAGLSSIVLVVTYQLPDEAEDRLLEAFERIVVGVGGEPPLQHPPMPLDRLPLDPVTKGPPGAGELVELASAAGRVAVRLVECYPPGVGVIVPGFEITEAATAYLLAAHAAGAEVVGATELGGRLTVEAIPTTTRVR